MFQIPKGMTEEEVLAIIENVANRLAKKFKFGYHDLDDMKQEARVIAIEKLVEYDGRKPLENFLYICVHNELFNFKRDNFERPDKPCYNCPFEAYLKDTKECSKYSNMLDCELYSKWYNRNSAKKNLMHTMTIDLVSDNGEENMHTFTNPIDNIVYQELIELIEQKIPMSLRADYFRLKNKIKIPKGRRTKVQEAVNKILKEGGYE